MQMLNSFFCNIIKNLEFPQYNQVDLICESIKDPVINAITKYRNYPSIIRWGTQLYMSLFLPVRPSIRPLRTIFQELYIMWSLFLVRMCKMMISPSCKK